MTNAWLKRLILLAMAAQIGYGDVVRAQVVDVYRERIRSASSPVSLSNSALGERYDFYKGGLSFYQEDLRLIGTGPDIVIGRTFDVGGRPGLPGLAGWQLTIPRLEIKTAGPLWGSGGNVAGYTYDRCTRFPGAPPSSVNTVQTRRWWNGVQYVDSVGGSRDVLRRSAENTLAPNGAAANFPAVTVDDMQFSCLPATANGEPGEGFLGVASDGTRYWFEWLIKGNLIDSASSMGPDGRERSVSIYRAAMMVTRVEDVHGNYITYSYSGNKLQSVNGSDGRHVVLEWAADRVVGVVSGARRWGYEYDAQGLSRVVLPDGSAYSFNLSELEHAYTVGVQVECGDPVSLSSITEGWPDDQGVKVGVITTPSGLTAEYRVALQLRARSKVPYSCISNPGEFPYVYISPYYASFSLISRRYSGPGLDETWLYDYSSADASWATCASCVGLAETKVLAPDGSVVRYLHSAEWSAYEGKLMEMHEISPSSTAARITRYLYAPVTGMPYPSSLGVVWNSLGMANVLPSTTHTPLLSESVTEGGLILRRSVDIFDGRARPIVITEYNEPAL